MKKFLLTFLITAVMALLTGCPAEEDTTGENGEWENTPIQAGQYTITVVFAGIAAIEQQEAAHVKLSGAAALGGAGLLDRNITVTIENSANAYADIKKVSANALSVNIEWLLSATAAAVSIRLTAVLEDGQVIEPPPAKVTVNLGGAHSVDISLAAFAENQRQQMHDKLINVFDGLRGNADASEKLKAVTAITVAGSGGDFAVTANSITLNAAWLSAQTVEAIVNQLAQAMKEDEPPVIPPSKVTVNLGGAHSVDISLAAFAENQRQQMHDKLADAFSLLAANAAIAAKLQAVTAIGIATAGDNFTITASSMTLNASWLSAQTAGAIGKQLGDAMIPPPPVTVETFNVPTWGGRLKGQEVTVEFRAGTNEERAGILEKITQAWYEYPMTLAERDDIWRDDYNTVLDRGLRIIVEAPEVFYASAKLLNYKTISYHIDYLSILPVTSISGNLDARIRNDLFDMTE